MAMLMVMSVTVALAGGAVATKPAQSEKTPVIIVFKDKSDPDLIKQHGGEIKCAYHIIPGMAASLSLNAIEALSKNPKIAYIVEDKEVFPVGQTLPWGVDRIDADVVHGYNKGTGVKVAIIDTGIDYKHPDLDGNYEDGYDFAENDFDPMDYHGHGTHCAGIVAAEDNDIGVIGVAPDADLYALKVFTDAGSGSYSDVVSALEWSIDNGMDVISMSIGSKGDPEIEPWIDKAYGAGIILIGAAGNEGNPTGRGDNVIYPAKYKNVTAVAATDISDNRASFSSTGPDVELSAPGVNIYSTVLGEKYGTKSGTSMACPHVAGTAALVIASGITDVVDVRARLQETAEDLGTTGLDTKYGYGLVDAEAAAASAVTLESITVTPETAFIPKGLTEQYTATGTYSDDSTADITSSVTWTSSDTLIAIIDSTGLATGEGEGTTTITASSNSISDTATLTVEAPILQSITVTPDTATIEVDVTQQYTAEGTYSDGSTLDITSSVNWASSDTGVAIIDSTGLATGVGEGTTTITASSTSISDTATLMVVTQVLEPTTVSVKSISYSTEGGRDGNKHLLITVALVDNLDNLVADASVSIDVYLGGSLYVSYTGTTGTYGTVTFKANNAPSGTYSTTVTDVTAGGLTWDGATPSNSFGK